METKEPEKSHGKCCCFWHRLPELAIIVALMVLIVAACLFFSQLIENLKDSRAQMRRHETCPIPMLSLCTLTEKNNSTDTICEAYEELDRELTSWLTVLTIAGALFGLIAPLIGYLLQQHNLKNERENLRADIKEKVALYYSTLKIDIDAKIKDVDKRIGQGQTSIIRSEEFPLVAKVRQVILMQQHPVTPIDPIDIANIIIGFDYLLESLVRWSEDAVIIRAKMHDWINNIDMVWREIPVEQREKVWKLLRGCFKPSSTFATRDDFLKILRDDSDDFKWLEDFFWPFAPWKFS